MVDERVGDSEKAHAADAPVCERGVKGDPVRILILAIGTELPAPDGDIRAVFDIDGAVEVVVDGTRDAGDSGTSRIGAAAVEHDVAGVRDLNPYVQRLNSGPVAAYPSDDRRSSGSVDVLKNDARGSVCSIPGDGDIEDHKGSAELCAIDEDSDSIDFVDRPGPNHKWVGIGSAAGGDARAGAEVRVLPNRYRVV